MSTFRIVASEFAAAFSRDNPRKVWALADDAPEWMRNAIYDAHFDGRLPDDWIYEHARAIVSDLSGRESVDSDTEHEICDGLVDVYTSALTSWLAAHNCNARLVDEAQAEGLVAEDATLAQRIAAAQYLALTRIYGALVYAIEQQADERDLEGA